MLQKLLIFYQFYIIDTLQVCSPLKILNKIYRGLKSIRNWQNGELINKAVPNANNDPITEKILEVRAKIKGNSKTIINYGLIKTKNVTPKSPQNFLETYKKIDIH